MTVREFHIPFCTEDDRLVSKHDQCDEPRMLDYTKLDVLKYHDGYVEVLIDDKTLALMGEGPFKILLAAARKHAIIPFEEVWKQETPYLVRRFFDMLQRDLKMITDPVFRRNWILRLIVVGGMTKRGWYEPHVSATEQRMMWEEIHRNHLVLLSDVTP